MRRAVLLFALGSGGCAAGQAEEPLRIVVPPQPPPPPPAPVALAPVPSAVVPVPVQPLTCEQGTAFQANDLAYCAYAQADTWEDAEERCVKTGGHLASIPTREVNDALHLVLGSPVRAGRAAWIGLESPTKSKAGWRWNTGEAVTAASWNASEPNNWDGNEACAEWLFANGRWNDTRCNLQQPFICESSGDKPLACTGHPVTGLGRSYCYVGREVTHAEAKAQCKQMGGRLATPKIAAENEALKKGMAQRFEVTRMWIGLNDRETRGSWEWSTKTRARFTAWEPGEPNAFGREACVELFADRWTWNDLDCEVKLPSVCEGPAKQP
ncbi:MAG: hypothetical protein KIT84_32780 [Labilithrix sp.]|nr:hypothetical protein [Labilithrix sp.]MCW5815851.1 hypothetical protein [Labilithrix sp.]